MSENHQNTELGSSNWLKTGGASLQWFHWLVIGLSMVVTISAWLISSQQAEEKMLLNYQRQVEQITDLVQERMRIYENVLLGGAALINTQDGDVDLDTWKTYADGLDIETKYPGINGIGVIFNVPPDATQDFLQDQQQQRPDFKIYPSHERADKWPITLIEPVAPNRSAVGLDIAFENNRYQGVIRARDTGLAQVTGPIVLVQDQKRTPGFLFYVPFYEGGLSPSTLEERQETIIGVSYAPFIMQRLMQGALATEKRELLIRIWDDGVELYSDEAMGLDEAIGVDPQPLLSSSLEIPIYGRTWRFNLETTLAFRGAATTDQPRMILIGGILIELLLIGLFMALGASKQRAVSIAQTATADLWTKSELLVKSNAKLGQRTKEVEEILQALEQNPCMILISDSEGRIKYANQLFFTAMGYSAEQVMNEPLDIFMKHKEDVSAYNEMWKTLDAGNAWQGELHDKRADGSVFWASVSGGPIKSGEGKLLGYCFTHQDITARKDIENKMDQALQQAEEAGRAKAEFLSNMSHEIRTPMNGIIMSLKLAQTAKLQPDTIELLDTANASATNLLAIINDILDLSKLESGNVNIIIGSLPVRDTMRFIARLMSPVAAEKGLMFSVNVDDNVPDWIMSDTVRLQQIINNMVSNAIKFTDTGDVKVNVSWLAETNQQGRIRLDISDTGLGISEKDKASLFERFQQVRSSDKMISGTGLGLAISKQLVELMDGEIGVISDGETGSTFWFEMPVKCGAAREQNQTAPPGPEVTDLNILIAEDIKTNAMLIERLIAKIGHRATIVENGLEAVKAVQSGTAYDLILMDNQMPVMSGIKATQKIRELDSPVKDIPIIALTADALLEHQNAFLDAGMNGFVAKPIQKAALTCEIQRVMQEHSFEQSSEI